MRNVKIIVILILLPLCSSVYGQLVGFRTDIPYLLTGSINAGIDAGLSRRTSMGLRVGYNPFEFGSHSVESDLDCVGCTSNTSFTNPKLRHVRAEADFKYWFCKRYERFYTGVHCTYLRYNVSGLPLNEKLLKYRHSGFGYGGGVLLGYQSALGDRMGLEFELGAGYIELLYDRYESGRCGEHLGKYYMPYIGITRAGISLIYYLR